MTKIQDLQKLILKFRNERDWQKYHKPKDCAMALVSEATEVLDHFKWKSEKEIKEYLAKNKKEVANELCDVLFWVLLLSYDLEINLSTAFQRKMRENAKNIRSKNQKARTKNTRNYEKYFPYTQGYNENQSNKKQQSYENHCQQRKQNCFLETSRGEDGALRSRNTYRR